MNLKRKNLSIIIIGFILTLLLCTAYFSAPFSKNNLEKYTRTALIQSFENFTPNTIIEITYKNKITQTLSSKSITISDRNHKIDLNNGTSDISYQIKNGSNYIDVTFIKDTIFISSLKKGTKIQLTSNNYKITDAIPVDWAGRLTLNNILSNNDLCLSILGMTEQKICHQVTRKVAS
jgi:hypothetical protein